MKLRILRRALLGFLAGIAVGNLIVIISGFISEGELLLFESSLLEKTGSEAGAFLVQTMLSGLYGAIGMGGAIVYELEDWPLLNASVIHYLIITLAFFPIGLYLGWMSPTLKDFLVIAVMLGIMNSIIWLTMYAVYHFEVEELNHLLKRNSDSEHKNPIT